jgi:glutamate-ammonia-ligase adenylyltransferase
MKRPIDIDAAELARVSRYADEVQRRWPDAPSPERPPVRPDAEMLQARPEAAIRRHRQLGSLHILWRDLSGQASAEETGQSLSSLARDCIDLALLSATRRIESDFGVLRDSEGERIDLSVIGLGKLGGHELNFNSDIDLVFIHRGSGRSDGRRALDSATYLKRVALELIRLLDAVTADGRAWVVDTRLRPFGSAGALVWSLGAIEQYFLNEGRAWERYAWMKASPVGGDTATAQTLIETLRPFIFRRYLDYGIFQSLRELHDQIEIKSRQDSRRDDIKRGPGGIRELEFLVQSQQILRGGRDRSLQVAGFQPALRALRQAQVFDADSQREMETAYEFLRILENRLQATSGQGTHHLPDRVEERDALVRVMGAADWTALSDELDEHRARVRAQFSARLGDHCVVDSKASVLWPPDDTIEDHLQAAGFHDPAAAADQLKGLARRIGHRSVSAEGRARLGRLMPSLLSEIIRHEQPETGLPDLLHLIEQISQRSAYLALLYERPATLKRLVEAFRFSGRLAEWIVTSPQLLDDLLDPVHGLTLPDPPRMDPGDPEASLFALGRWRQAGFLRTGLAEMDGVFNAVQAADQLSHVASICIERILELIEPEQRCLAVIAYGNLGAGLLHFDSDLDLVFLHHGNQAPMRTAQRLISYMQLPLPGGRLFEIDTRLRPNGGAGTLVSSLENFRRYQLDEAETWEHQALIRARWVAGDPAIADAFSAIRAEVLESERDNDLVRRSLATMRERQKAERQETPIKSLLTDLQFIAECGVLCLAGKHPGLIDHRRPGELLRHLSRSGWLDPSLAEALAEPWETLLAARHLQWLSRDETPADLVSINDAIERAWRDIFDRPG